MSKILAFTYLSNCILFAFQRLPRIYQNDPYLFGVARVLLLRILPELDCRLLVQRSPNLHPAKSAKTGSCVKWICIRCESSAQSMALGTTG